MPVPLPVDSCIDQLFQAIDRKNIVALEAPPGSGKSTRVPLRLLERQHDQTRGQTILLQPRRLAAVGVASRIADEHGSPLGGKIGYSVRFDSRRSGQTQLLVCTEGILRRMLSSDVTLPGISLVIFDEFHERSLDADLLLAMLRQLQRTLRPDLKLLIMTATFDDRIAEAIDELEVICVDARTYPVAVEYQPLNPRDRLDDATAAAAARAFNRSDGDVLVFLPGRGEIEAVAAKLGSSRVPAGSIYRLHGTLSLDEQRRAISPSSDQRIILSTNIAETSLTVPGVTTVVDSGLARVMRYDPAKGLDRLQLETITQASATQRAGRAGRVAAGRAIRLYAEQSFASRPAYLEPELHRVDLSEAMLQLLQWGENDWRQLPWLTPPREGNVEAAVTLLERLGLIEGGALNSLGSLVAEYPTHPRLGRLIAGAAGHRERLLGCMAAALLSERDPFFPGGQRGGSGTIRRGGGETGGNSSRRWDCDVCERIEVLLTCRGGDATPFGVLDSRAVKQLFDVAERLYRVRAESQSRIEWPSRLTAADREALRRGLLTAYPDRVAMRRRPGDRRAVMVGGVGTALSDESGVVFGDYFLCLDADNSGVEAKVRWASEVHSEWLRGNNRRETDDLFYSPTANAVICRRRQYWLDLVIGEQPASIADPAAAADVLASAMRQMWPKPISGDAKERIDLLIGRIRIAANAYPEAAIPAIGEAELKQLLPSICQNKTRMAEVQSSDWEAYLLGSLAHEQRVLLSRELPTKITVPSGRTFAIDYSGERPMLSLRIQDAFGMDSNPTICGGRVPLQMQLLAPNGRPQQITTDLPSFWRNGYTIVRKELKRRYAKHAWPDQPWLSPEKEK